jgi:hypothetical protein
VTDEQILIAKLRDVIQQYVELAPAFRSRIIGAYGSPARMAQAHHIALEDLAKSLLVDPL